MNRLIQVINYAPGIRIREYIVSNNGERYFTATILKWRGFKFFGKNMTSTELLTTHVIPKTLEIKENIKDKTISEQAGIIDKYPTTYNF